MLMSLSILFSITYKDKEIESALACTKYTCEYASKAKKNAKYSMKSNSLVLNCLWV